MKLSLMSLATMMFLAGCSAADDARDDGVDEGELKKRIGSQVSTVGMHFEDGTYGAGGFLNWISVVGSNGKFLPAVARTQTGVDLVEGEYEVHVRADGSVGPLGQTHRVSFP